jgi:hypothetical protein
MKVENDHEDLRNIPGSDAVHFVILRRVEDLEKEHKEFDRWRTKADIMLDNVAHLEAKFDASMKEQTGQILSQLTSVKDELKLVVKDQTFWANSRTIARWLIAVSATLIGAAWAVSTFVYDHYHSAGSK